MTLFDLNPLLAMGSPPQAGQPAPPVWMNMVPLGLLVVVFYFALIRPQQKKAKEQAEMLKGVRPGDKIVTTGGIIGTVINVNEKAISIRSADAKFEITKSAIARPEILCSEISCTRIFLTNSSPLTLRIPPKVRVPVSLETKPILPFNSGFRRSP